MFQAFFPIMLAAIAIGALHGLVLPPALLTLLGPTRRRPGTAAAAAAPGRARGAALIPAAPHA